MNLFTEIAQIYATLTSVIIAGVLNMIFVKLPIIESLKKPIDQGKYLRDGKRLFGENKTWKGFIGMIILGGVSQVIWGAVCSTFPLLEAQNQLIAVHGNSFSLNLSTGFLFGLAYALFELPNSFIKRRILMMAFTSSTSMIPSAAVTIVGMYKNAIDSNPQDIVMFIADRPFIFVIQENSTGAVLFIGQKVS